MSARERTITNLRAEHQALMAQRALEEQQRKAQQRADHQDLCHQWWVKAGRAQFVEKFGFTPLDDTVEPSDTVYAITFETSDGLLFRASFHPRNDVAAWQVKTKNGIYISVAARSGVTYLAFNDNLYVKE